MRLLACLIVAPQRGYDEPAILSYAISSFCPTSADGLHYYAQDGGLNTYGPNTLDPVRRAAEYVNRILRGEKPAHLPVQAPTKYELVINLKTAKALGVKIPTSLLTRADEVIVE